MIMELQKVPAGETRVEVQDCGLVTMRVNGQEIQFWLGDASSEELVNLILFFKDEIHNRHAENRVEIFGYLKTINGELDARVNAVACGVETPRWGVWNR